MTNLVPSLAVTRAKDSILRSARVLNLTENDHIDYNEWVEIGHELGRRLSGYQWQVGDWILYGEWEYGTRYQEALHIIGVDYQTLRHWASVAGKYNPDRRRDITRLSFSHHQLVAGLTEAAQEYWLDKAEAEGLSRHALYAELQAAGVVKGGKTAELASPTFRLVLTSAQPDHIATWQQAAEHRGITLEEFAALAMDELAATELQDAA